MTTPSVPLRRLIESVIDTDTALGDTERALAETMCQLHDLVRQRGRVQAERDQAVRALLAAVQAAGGVVPDALQHDLAALLTDDHTDLEATA